MPISFARILTLREVKAHDMTLDTTSRLGRSGEPAAMNAELSPNTLHH